MRCEISFLTVNQYPFLLLLPLMEMMHLLRDDSRTWKLVTLHAGCHVFLQHFTPRTFFPTPLVSGELFCSNFTIFIFMNETHSPAPAHTDHTPSSQGDYSLFLYFYICYSRFLSPFQYSAAQSSPRCIIIFLCFSMLLLLRCFYCTLLHSLSVDLAGIAAL